VASARRCRQRATAGIRSIDLQADLGIRDDDEALLYFVQNWCWPHAGGFCAPVDGVNTAIDDVESLQRRYGARAPARVRAKLCIHRASRDVEPRVLCRPTRLVWARRVLEAAANARVRR